jgi:flagellar hook-associated protein 3 FlgL
MRVTQSMMYSSFVSNMNENLSQLMELNIKSSSQKNINKPSDDPVGMARVLSHRSTLNELDRYQKNVDTATGWLSLADETLMQVSTIVTRARELAEQAASGTYTGTNREQISYEVRQLFDQLLGLANTTYEGKSIFAGHKVDQNAYAEGLTVSASDGTNLAPYVESLTGQSEKSVLVQLLGTGTAVVGQDNIDYRYSTDGGTTWSSTQTLAGAGAPPLPPNVTMSCGGVDLKLKSGLSVDLSAADDTSLSQGTWLKIMPSAVYQGDEENNAAAEVTADPSGDVTVTASGGFERDVRIQVTGVGPGSRIDYDYTAGGQTFSLSSDGPVLNLPEGRIELKGTPQAGLDFTVRSGAVPVDQLGSTVNAYAQGTFNQNVVVRIDEDQTIGSGTAIKYAYSQDGGRSWKTGNEVPNPVGGSPRIILPGGSLTLSSKPGPNGSQLTAGDQLVVHPETANINIDISATEKVRVNNIGKDIFGGYYTAGTAPVFEDDESQNLFLAMGRLVGALETNSQEGVQEALDDLKTSQSTVMNGAASIGGRENRLEIAASVLSRLELDENDRLGQVEDVDITELMTKIAQHEIAYQAVLKSSSTIMNLSLMNYL